MWLRFYQIYDWIGYLAPNISNQYSLTTIFAQIRAIGSKNSVVVRNDPRQDLHFNIFKQAKDYEGKEEYVKGLGTGVEKYKDGGFAISFW